MAKTVVVVDEDPEFVHQLANLLTKAGYEAVGCVGHDEAISAIERLGKALDLAIIDFVVPGTTGPELAGTVRRNLPGLKIVATVPGEHPDLTPLVSQTDADLVVRRPKVGEPLDREKWIAIVSTMLAREEAA